MATAMVRTVGTWSQARVAGAVAGLGVMCAGEPAGKAQRVSTRRANGAGQVAMPTSGDGAAAQLRCQAAATLTAVREVAMAEETESRHLDESRAALAESFQAAAVSGRMECVDTQECRPVVDMAYEQTRMYYGRRGGGDAYMPASMNPVDADEAEVQMGQSEMVAAFEAALQEAGRSAEKLGQLAAQAWRKLGDADRAEQLYMQALQLAPEDSAIQASYAQFLWQCDA